MSNAVRTGQDKRFDNRPGTENSVAESVRQSCSSIERCVQEAPMNSVLVSLAAGLGVGLVVGLVIGRDRSDASRWLESRTAENLGRRVMNQVGRWVPDSLTERFSS